MRKTLLCILLTAMSLETFAQSDDNQLFNHFGVGVGVGLSGITLDVATTCTPYVGIRAGINFMPKISLTVSETNKYDDGTNVPDEVLTLVPDEVDVKGDVKLTTGRVLFDIFPGRTTKFHFTVGAYFGSGEIVKLYNKDEGVLSSVTEWNAANPDERIGIELGNYLLTPDDKGNISGSIKVSGFRPYLGIGFGRTIPSGKIGWQTDLGVQFWGSPKVYCYDEQLTEEKVGGDNEGIIKTISEITVYPTLTFRLSTRII